MNGNRGAGTQPTMRRWGWSAAFTLVVLHAHLFSRPIGLARGAPGVLMDTLIAPPPSRLAAALGAVVALVVMTAPLLVYLWAIS